MFETLAQWFVDGGWGSFTVMVWVPFGFLFAFVSLLAMFAKWRAARVLGAICLVFSVATLASGAIGVYSGYSKHDLALAGDILGPAMKQRMLNLAYQEAKGCAKLALVFSLPSLLIGAIVSFRSKRAESPDASPSRIRSLVPKVILLLAGLLYVGNIGIVLAKGPGQDPGSVELDGYDGYGESAFFGQ